MKSSAQWRIPAERMKMRLEHLVPLSRQAVAVLRELRAQSGSSPNIFPSPGKGAVCPATPCSMRSTEWDITAGPPRTAFAAVASTDPQREPISSTGLD